MYKNILIVGAGLFGSVLAERITSELNKDVTVIDKRNHIGGNCYAYIDEETQIECHQYGPHVFHTSKKNVLDYIRRFTDFNAYEHHVYSMYQNTIYPLPINLMTINQFYHKNLTPNEAQEFIAHESQKEQITEPKNLEEKAISLIGRPLYEAFIKFYTIKQWNQDPLELSPDIITRLPVRYTYNNNYFHDSFTGLPLQGYKRLFENLLHHPKIHISLNTDWQDVKQTVKDDTCVIFTGPIDQFFDFSLGYLDWRSVDFEIERFNYSDYQGATTVNYPEPDKKYTRIVEYKNFHPERVHTNKTIIFKEYSRFSYSNDAPYYPINTAKNNQLYQDYKLLASKLPNVFFGGRLGLYKYFDMDVTIDRALTLYNDTLSKIL